jgi:hypothetical protein
VGIVLGAHQSIGFKVNIICNTLYYIWCGL